MFQDLISFLKKPETEFAADSKISFNDKLKYSLNMTCLMLGVAVIFGILGTIISNFFGFSSFDNYVVVNEISKQSVWAALFILVFFGPFREEWAFRLFLSKKKNIILLGFLGFGIFFVDVLSSLLDPGGRFVNYYFLSLGLLILLISSLQILLPKLKIELFISRHSRFFLYASAILFGLVHITNYNNISQFWWLAIILVMPQIIVGLFLPLIRVKLGFWWAVFVHGLYNFILGLNIILLLAGPSVLREYITKDITAEILSKFSSFEQFYFRAVNISQSVVYLTVFVVFIYHTSIYLKIFTPKLKT